MRAKTLAAGFFGLALALMAMWLDVRTDGLEMGRLHFFLSGDWKIKLVSEEPEARGQHADSFGLAYRVSAYRDGHYLGCYTREGQFNSADGTSNERLVG